MLCVWLTDIDSNINHIWTVVVYLIVSLSVFFFSVYLRPLVMLGRGLPLAMDRLECLTTTHLGLKSIIIVDLW